MNIEQYNNFDDYKLNERDIRMIEYEIKETSREKVIDWYIRHSYFHLYPYLNSKHFGYYYNLKILAYLKVPQEEIHKIIETNYNYELFNPPIIYTKKGKSSSTRIKKKKDKEINKAIKLVKEKVIKTNKVITNFKFGIGFTKNKEDENNSV
jgi:hypothetical protein